MKVGSHISKLEDKLFEIRDLYFVSLSFSYLNHFPNTQVPSSQNMEQIPICAAIRTLIAYKNLSPIYQEIINNEFFYQNYDGWWKDIYSPKEFKEKKIIAMEKFLSYYED